MSSIVFQGDLLRGTIQETSSEKALDRSSNGVYLERIDLIWDLEKIRGNFSEGSVQGHLLRGSFKRNHHSRLYLRGMIKGRPSRVCGGIILGVSFWLNQLTRVIIR